MYQKLKCACLVSCDLLQGSVSHWQCCGGHLLNHCLPWYNKMSIWGSKRGPIPIVYESCNSPTKAWTEVYLLTKNTFIFKTQMSHRTVIAGGSLCCLKDFSSRWTWWRFLRLLSPKFFCYQLLGARAEKGKGSLADHASLGTLFFLSKLHKLVSPPPPQDCFPPHLSR